MEEEKKALVCTQSISPIAEGPKQAALADLGGCLGAVESEQVSSGHHRRLISGYTIAFLLMPDTLMEA